jgi:two pore calcium channel protein
VLVGRRGEAITKGNVYEKAAAMVDQAEDGVGLPPEVLEQSNFEESAKLYFAYIRLDFLWHLNLAALLLLNFFEVPLWCKEKFPSPCGERDKFFLGDLPYLTRYESLIFETVILIILGLSTFLPIAIIGIKLFWKSRLEVLRVKNPFDNSLIFSLFETISTESTMWAC